MTKVNNILFGGDQLMVAKAMGAKQARMNSVKRVTHQEGLVPCAEDRHVKISVQLSDKLMCSIENHA